MHSTMYESIASERSKLVLLLDEINNSTKRFIEFKIPHQIVINRFIHTETLEFDVAPGNHNIFKPGVRKAAIIPHEYIGSSSHPIKMTTLCSGSSIPKAVRNDDKHADTLRCVNNYKSGNLMMISMTRVNTLKE